MKRLVGLLTTILIASVPAAAAGEALGVLAVAPPPGPGPELAAMAGELRAAFGAQIEGVIEAAALRQRMAGKPAGPALAELDRAFLAARRAAVKGDEQASIQALRQLISDLEKLPDGDETQRQWIRAVLRLAKTVLDLGRAAEADALLEQVARASPEAQADPSLYPRSFAERLQAARARLKGLPQRKLTIVADGAEPALAFVEGRAVGATPVTVSLPAGRYRVSGQLGGVVSPRQPVTLGSQDLSVKLDFDLPDRMRPARGPGIALLAADDLPRLLRIGAHLGLDRLVTVALEDRPPASLRATLYDVTGGLVERSGRVRLAGKALPPGGAAALARYLHEGAVADPVFETRAGSQPAVLHLPQGMVAVHYFRADGKYDAWGLHAWESYQARDQVRDDRAPKGIADRPLGGLGWESPIGPTGRDLFGAYWLLDAQEFGNGRVNFAILAGKRRELCGKDPLWLVPDAREVWVNAGDCQLHFSQLAALKARQVAPPRGER